MSFLCPTPARRRRRRAIRRSPRIGRGARGDAARACVQRTVSASSIHWVRVLVVGGNSDSRGVYGGAEYGSQNSTLHFLARERMRERMREVRQARRVTSTAPAADDWWSHASEHVKQLVDALGGIAVISVDEFHRVVRVAFARTAAAGVVRPAHSLSPSSRATVARLASAANVSLRRACWQPGVFARVPRMGATRGTRRDRSTSEALVVKFRRIFVLDLGTGTSPLSDYVTSEKLDDVWVVITVDKDPKRKPSVCEDILEWPRWLAALERRVKKDFKEFKGWDWIHFSPCCREFSSSKTVGERDIDGALLLVHAGLSLISSRAPRLWTMESSAHGAHALQTHACMRALDDVMLPHAIHFCQSLGLGNWKPGRWWTSMPGAHVAPLLVLTCTRELQCAYCATFGKHRLTSQGGKSATGALGMTLDDRMRFPPYLVHTLFVCVANFLRCNSSN